MTGPTTITYGDTSIYNVVTRRFQQENVYDDSEGMVMYTRTTIEISGTLHGVSGFLHDHEAGRNAGSPAMSHRRLRAILFHPRRDFEMKVGSDNTGHGGQVLFECRASRHPEEGGDPSTYNNPGGIDLENGPKVSDIEITRIAGNESFLVSCTFTIAKRECDPEGTAGATNNPIKSLTWSVEDDIDKTFTTTRTYVGRLVLNHANINPNSLRGYVVPPLLPGMMRRQMRFNVTRKRTEMDFTIVDREVHFSPPEPAKTWHFEHTIETGEGLLRFGTVKVSLGGDRYVNKSELMNLALRIIKAKLYRLQNNVEADFQTYLEQISITDVYSDDESRIHASCRVRYTGDDLDTELRTILGRLGKPLDGNTPGLEGYDYRYSYGSPERGVAGQGPTVTPLEGPIDRYGAIVVAFGDACGAYRTLGELSRRPERKPIRGEEEDPGENGEPETDVEVNETPTLPEQSPGHFSVNHNAAIYTHWQMETLYDNDEGVIGLPVAGRANVTSATGDTEFVRVHPPQATRIVRASGERMGAWPDFPLQETFTDENGIRVRPLKTKVLSKSQSWSGDGKPVYRGKIEYVQGLSRSPNPNETLMGGYNPWDVLGLQGAPGSSRSTSLNAPVNAEQRFLETIR